MARRSTFRLLAFQRQDVLAFDKGRQGRRRRDVLASVAGLFALGGAGFAVVRPPMGPWPSLAELTADHRTGPNQRYAFAPAPGVRVDMNAGTGLSLRDQGSGVRLIHGEAFVAVAPRQAVLRVEAGPVVIRTAGARFNVQALGGAVNVVCAEGAVSCTRGREAPTWLRPGDGLSLDGAGSASTTRVDPTTASAWLQGLLIFNGGRCRR